MFLPFLGFAQEKDKDRGYVEKMNPLFSTRPYMNQNVDILFMNYKDSDNSPFMYRPATGLNVGGEIAFKFLHFTYEKNLPLLQPKLPVDMSPDHQRVGVNMGGKIFGMHITYEQNKGFYLMNPNMSLPDTLRDHYGVNYRNDMRSRTFGVDFRFTFSNKLSANAIFVQSERQIKSKGAFTLIVGNRFNNIDGDQPLLPFHVRGDFQESSTMTKVWSNTIHVMPGYGYIAVDCYIYCDLC